MGGLILRPRVKVKKIIKDRKQVHNCRALTDVCVCVSLLMHSNLRGDDFILITVIFRLDRLPH